MRNVRALSLAMAAASIATVVVASVAVWLIGSMPVETFPSRSATEYSAKIQSAPSCEALKQVCVQLASAHELQGANVAFLNRGVDEVLSKLAIFIVGWGIVSAVSFIYIFSVSRRAERENRVAP